MKKRAKILVVGSFVMDMISSAKRLPGMGETVIGNEFRTAPGGKGANQAVQCAKLGAEVVMVGCVGDDAFGHEMLQAVQAAGVDISKVKISRKFVSGVGNVQVEMTETGVQNRIMVIPGANEALYIEDLEWLEDEIKGYDLVMMQLELSMEVTEYVAECAFRAGVPVMLNPAPAAKLSSSLLSHITYLSPNEHEAALLAQHPIHIEKNGVNKTDLNEVAECLFLAGVKNLLITLGSNGSVLCKRNEKAGEDVASIDNTPKLIYGECVYMSEVKDPTAAGDSFIGAFCTGIVYGLSEEEALAFAAYAAALTVCGMGGIPSIPTLEQVKDLLCRRNCEILNVSRLEEIKW